MNNFDYAQALVPADALHRKIAHVNAQYIGGGTNLIDLMKESVAKPELLIDLNKLELKQITENKNDIMIGALVTNADLAYHSTIQKHLPLLSQAILAGASPQLRNMATTGGNLMQRTRCYYFYDVTTACNKREPGSGCAAISGLNRMHAILGHSSSCIAVHPSDMCVALAALGASVIVLGAEGEREIPILEFHRLPEDRPHLDNTLKENELITHVKIPLSKFNQNFTYLKIRDRASYSFALVSVAAALELEGNKIKKVAVALGGVAHKPWRNLELEETLKGKETSTETFAAFAKEFIREAKGFEHNSFKIKLAERAIIKALREATQRKSV